MIQTITLSYQELKKGIEENNIIIDRQEPSRDILGLAVIIYQDYLYGLPLSGFQDDEGKTHILYGIGNYYTIKDFIDGKTTIEGLPGEYSENNGKSFDMLSTFLKHQMKYHKAFYLNIIDYETDADTRNYVLASLNKISETPITDEKLEKLAYDYACEVSDYDDVTSANDIQAYKAGFHKGETNPDDETIEKIIKLVGKWNHYMSQTFGDIDNKEDCLSYIKNHWKE